MWDVIIHIVSNYCVHFIFCTWIILTLRDYLKFLLLDRKINVKIDKIKEIVNED